MASNKDGESIARFLHCSSILEEKVAQAYKNLSERVKDPLIRSLLLYISRDSGKHAVILKGIGENIMKVDVDEEECEERWGQLWKKVITFSEEEVERRGEVGDEELATLVDKMMDIEGFVGEEYLIAIQISILQIMAEELKIDLEDVKKLLEWVVEDEKRHEEILITIKYLVSKRRRG